MRNNQEKGPKHSQSWFKNQSSNFVEAVIPLPGKEQEAADDGLFDDCPLCQMLREDIAAGGGEVDISDSDCDVN